jgi:hypothetical protein
MIYVDDEMNECTVSGETTKREIWEDGTRNIQTKKNRRLNGNNL